MHQFRTAIVKRLVAKRSPLWATKQPSSSSTARTSLEPQPSTIVAEEATLIKASSIPFEADVKFRQDIYEEEYARATEHLQPDDWLQGSTAVEIAEGDDVAPDSVDDAIGAAELEEQEALRDVSKMKSWHRFTYHGVPPPMEVYDWQYERRALKERYAKYGKASGVNPGVMWPTEDELIEKAAIEQERQPQLFTVLHQLDQQRQEKARARQARIEEVESNLEKYPKILAEYEAKLKEADDELAEAEASKEKKVREIQEYFGYAVDPSDPRFQDMMAKKDEDEKKAKRLAKKLERERKLTAQLQVTAEAEQEADTKAP